MEREKGRQINRGTRRHGRMRQEQEAAGRKTGETTGLEADEIDLCVSYLDTEGHGINWEQHDGTREENGEENDGDSHRNNTVTVVVNVNGLTGT